MLLRRFWLLAMIALAGCFNHPAGEKSCSPSTCLYEPICGDGVCSSEESWQSCPADCPKPVLVETCNGKDDDGDGRVDEGDPGGGVVCDTGKPGLCASGVGHCASGVLTCMASASPAPEQCNGVDDDCDGRIDEGDPGGGASCATGKPGVCAAGVIHCSAGNLSCSQQVMSGPEICDNGRDDNCDGRVDEGCPPPPTVLRLPMNGAYTGSVWATKLRHSPLRPTFAWDAEKGATHYQLQADDSCTPGSLSSCVFPSPEVDVSVTVPRWTPTTDLPVRLTQPVGATFAWRVRTCNDTACSEWSMTRYVRVGRLPDDFNGDGYGDVLVGGASSLTIDYGFGDHSVVTSGIPPVPADAGVAFAGDIDGDGYSDALVAATVPEPMVQVLMGGPAGGIKRSLTLRALDDRGRFGAAVAGGDVNGDGLDDVVVGAPGDQAGRGDFFLYMGTGTDAVLTDSTSRSGLAGAAGTSLAVADIDGDGFADVLVGAPGTTTSDGHSGAVMFFPGGPTGIEASARATFGNPDPVASSVDMGHALVACDFDGDGKAELAVSATRDPGRMATTGHVGHVRVFSLDASGVTSQPVVDPQGDTFGYGYTLAAADLNGDGSCDLLIGSPFWTPASSSRPLDEGIVEAFMGGASGLTGTAVADTGEATIPLSGRRFGIGLTACDRGGDGPALVVASSQPDRGASYRSYHQWTDQGFELWLGYFDARSGYFLLACREAPPAQWPSAPAKG